MASNTTVLVTGANRGLGKGLVEHYLSQPNYTIIAAVRDPEHSTSKALNSIPKAKGTNLVLIKIDSSSETDPKTAMSALTSTHNIKSLDIVIANAGIAKVFPTVKDATPSQMKEHLEVNLIGIVLLFQAVLPLLEDAKTPKFITMSSGVASLNLMAERSVPNTPYAASKVALNYVTRRIHLEHENIIAVPLDPGWVQTDMGNLGARELAGLEHAPLTIKESVAGMVQVIDTATKEKTSGDFMVHDGSVSPW